jgi:sugar phosphate isomerase/epimerase
MKIGVCIKPEMIATAAAIGFDYVELGASQLENMDEVKYSDIKRATNEAGIQPEVFNVFLPGSLKVVGPDVDEKAIEDYMLKVLGRVSDLGGKIIVFGSGASRKCPENWSLDKALSQYIDAAKIAGDIGAGYGVLIALEHLNKGETNIVNSVADAWKAAIDSKNDNIKVIVDSYHMNVENENYSILEGMKEYIAHVHIARSKGRYYPMHAEEDTYSEFIAGLRAAGYDNRMSIEGGCSDFSTEAPKALAFLKAITA